MFQVWGAQPSVSKGINVSSMEVIVVWHVPRPSPPVWLSIVLPSLQPSHSDRSWWREDKAWEVHRVRLVLFLVPRLSLVPLTQRDHLLLFPVWFQVVLLFRATNCTWDSVSCQSFLQLTFLLLSGNGIAERFWKPTLGASMQINPCFLCAYFTWTLTVPASTSLRNGHSLQSVDGRLAVFLFLLALERRRCICVGVLSHQLSIYPCLLSPDGALQRNPHLS